MKLLDKLFREKVLENKLDEIQALIHKGADIELNSFQGLTALAYASSKGETELVALLCQKQANLEVTDIQGRTPLLIAAYNGHMETVEILLENGANIDAKDKEGMTSLIWATRKGHSETVTKILAELLKKNSDIDEFDEERCYNALMWAAQEGKTDVLIKLLEAGADTELYDIEGRFALAIAASNDHTDIIDALLTHGAGINHQSEDNGSTALMWAALKGKTRALEKLLTYGADIEAKDDNDSTAIIWASSTPHTQTLLQLISAGVNLNVQNNTGRTPLMLAANEGHAATLSVLLSAGANTEIRDTEGKTAQKLAFERGHAQILELLKPYQRQENETFADVNLLEVRLSKINYEPNRDEDDFYRCPISHEIMLDPITASSGITFDRSSIKQLFLMNDKQKIPCPVTRILIQKAELENRSNTPIKALIERFVLAEERKYEEIQALKNKESSLELCSETPMKHRAESDDETAQETNPPKKTRKERPGFFNPKDSIPSYDDNLFTNPPDAGPAD